MRKILFSLALTCGLVASALAQTNTVRLRAEVGANVNDLTIKAAQQAVDAKGKLGLRANLGLEFRILPAGLYAYGALGYRSSNAGFTLDKVDNTTKIHYATLGAGLGYRMRLAGSIALSLEAGALGGYALKGENATTFAGKELSVDIFKDENGGFKRPTYAVGAALALEFASLYVRGGLEYALNNVYEQGAGQALVSGKGHNYYISFGFYL